MKITTNCLLKNLEYKSQTLSETITRLDKCNVKQNFLDISPQMKTKEATQLGTITVLVAND
jgi:hypothetical protein